MPRAISCGWERLDLPGLHVLMLMLGVCPRKCVGMNERDRHAIDKQNAEEQDQ
jgi:hypothetical protein